VLSHWFEQAYQPVAQIIEETESYEISQVAQWTDLYLWTVEHRAALEEAIGQEIRPEASVRHLADRFSSRPARIASRLGRKIKKLLIPKRLETGPAPGKWREEKLASPTGAPATDHMFRDILGDGEWKTGRLVCPPAGHPGSSQRRGASARASRSLFGKSACRAPNSGY